MSRSKQTGLKREKEKLKLKKRQEKEEKKQERKNSSNKGKGFDSMIAYVDENGHLSSTPPDPSKRKELDLDSIQLGAHKPDETEKADYVNNGKITFYNQEKGYGFIRDSRTGESVFFHLNALNTPVQLNDQVSFEKTSGPKGMSAVNVTKIG
jgi:cold shock CspA family protein